MRKTSVYLEDAQPERLARLARREGRSQSEIPRDAVAAYEPPAASDRQFEVPTGAARRDSAELQSEQGELVIPAPVTVEIDHLFGQRFGATAQRAFLGEPVAILAGRDRTTRILSFDQRLFRAIAPPQGGAFTILPADGDH